MMANEHHPMRIVLRADASLEIGTGHVIRCLTLAHALRDKGADCHFICREHSGNLVESIRSKGFVVHALHEISVANEYSSVNSSKANQLVHWDWLGATQQEDAEVCAGILEQLQPDWLIVDHYGLDIFWEQKLKPHFRKLMVIDDLADRAHQCDLLLDQTFGRNAADYLSWVPSDTKLMCGSQYALLRPDFANLRQYSLQRRLRPKLRQLLISFGGVDRDNMTVKVLEILRSSSLLEDCHISVVMGSTAPWLNEVQRFVQDMPWPTSVQVDVNNMAQLMADSDLAIGAAGATSWERCCLGLPTVMLVLADNQIKIAQALSKAGAVIKIDRLTFKVTQLINADMIESDALAGMSSAASKVTDGLGTQRILHALCNEDRI